MATCAPCVGQCAAQYRGRRAPLRIAASSWDSSRWAPSPTGAPHATHGPAIAEVLRQLISRLRNARHCATVQTMKTWTVHLFQEREMNVQAQKLQATTNACILVNEPDVNQFELVAAFPWDRVISVIESSAVKTA